MTHDFQPGDRVRIRNGEIGTVIQLDGGMAHLNLDSSVRKRVVIVALKKIAGDDSTNLADVKPG